MSLTAAIAQIEEAFGELKKAVAEDDGTQKAKPTFGGKKAPPFPPKPGGGAKPGEEEEDEDGKKPPPFPPAKDKKKSLDEKLAAIEDTISAFGKAVEDDPIRKSDGPPAEDVIKGSMVYDGHPVIDAPAAGWPRDMTTSIKKSADADADDDRDFGKDPWGQRVG